MSRNHLNNLHHSGSGSIRKESYTRQDPETGHIVTTTVQVLYTTYCTVCSGHRVILYIVNCGTGKIGSHL